jgi:hypothetical protein
VGEFLLAVLSGLIASGIIEIVKLLMQNSKGGALMFPGMAKLLPA